MLKTALKHSLDQKIGSRQHTASSARRTGRQPQPNGLHPKFQAPPFTTPAKRPSTHLVALLHVHVAVGIVVHLLVDVADGLEAELLVLVVAQGLVDAAELCWGRKHPREGQPAPQRPRRGP